jgi:hypothetical protein
MPLCCEANPHSSSGTPANPHYIVILGPLKKVHGGLTHLLVVIDKFTKWIEVRSLAKSGSKHSINFIHDIIFRFGVPNSIVTDNNTQFTRERFLDCYHDNNIRVD